MKKRILKLLTVLLITITIFGCGNNVDKVRNKMEKYLYEKYGEEFVVDRIGRRSANGQEFYQARIYPKSIIGTNREDDDYYYASSSIDIKSFGRLGKPGDSYSFINRNDDVENYLLPKAKEIFGERIRLKVDVKHEVTGDGSWWAGYKSSSLQEMRDDMKEYPDTTRIVLSLSVYIFDKIEREEEKSRRQEETFEFIQYLKGEGLFEYLKMGVIFIDEKVLAPSYKKYRREIKYLDLEKVEVEGEVVYLPPKEFREEMSKVLGEEILYMDENKKKLAIDTINKENLEYINGSEYLRYSNQGRFWIESLKYLIEINKYGGYKEAKEKGDVKRHNFKNKKDCEYKNYNYYIF